MMFLGGFSKKIFKEDGFASAKLGHSAVLLGAVTGSTKKDLMPRAQLWDVPSPFVFDGKGRCSCVVYVCNENLKYL